MPKSKTRSRTAAQIIAAAKRPEKDVTVYFRADLLAQVEALEADLLELQQNRKGDVRLGTGASDEEREIAEQIQALEAESEQNSLVFTLRAMPRSDWRKAREDCPPTDNERKEGWLVNRDSLVEKVLADSIVQPELDEESLGGLVDNLSEGQWARLRDGVMEVNGGDGSIPFSRSASLILRNSKPAAASPEPTVSASAASTDGNPAA